LAFVAKRMLELDSTLRKKPYDILHVLSGAGYSFFRNALHIKIARRYGVKTVFHLLGQIDDMYRDALEPTKRFISFCLDLADVHLVQSPLLAEYVRKITKRPVYSIFNGVETASLHPVDGYAHSNGRVIKVITLGYLGYQKGTYDIINAAERLKNKCPEIEFILVGGGEIEKFEKLVASKNLLNRISFMGIIPDNQRTRMLQNSDLFLLPSHAEGQPIALLEAMAAGLPIISSTVGSVPEVVKEGVNGFLFQPGDIDRIATYVEFLADNKALREKMGRFNAQEAKEKYQIERVMWEIQNVYEKLVIREN
jgi:glycosyltransferase involved in cell wall biosynthesis